MDELGLAGTLAPTYPQEAMMKQAASSQRATVTDSLLIRKANLEAQLGRVNAALEALKKNPDLENALNLIQQASY